MANEVCLSKDHGQPWNTGYNMVGAKHVAPYAHVPLLLWSLQSTAGGLKPFALGDVRHMTLTQARFSLVDVRVFQGFRSMARLRFDAFSIVNCWRGLCCNEPVHGIV